MSPTPDLQSTKAAQILREASESHYGIPAICVYNIEGILATVRAASSKHSPAMLLLFPWAQTYSSSVLARAAHEAAATSPVPITVHLDHAQSPQAVKEAADLGTYDSIMVDMSHYEHEENLRLTKELTGYCHERGILVEAECGRIEGGEDGVKSTEDLEAIMTTKEQAREFVETGIDWLAPAFGNVHGKYGSRGIQLDFERLKGIKEVVGETRLVLHGTDGFDEGLYKECIGAGIVKCNINRAVNEKLTGLWKKSEKGLTGVMEEGTSAMQVEIEKMMDWLGSTGKAW